MIDLDAAKSLSRRTREEWDSVFDGDYSRHSYLTVLNLLNKIDMLADEVERLSFATRLRPDYPIRCGRCGAPHILDTVVPSVVWNRAVRAKGLPETLCTLCIHELVSEAGLKCEVEFYFVGGKLGIGSRAYKDDIGTVAMLERDLEEARAAFADITRIEAANPIHYSLMRGRAQNALARLGQRK